MPTPALPPEALHLPIEDGPFRMAMALVPCAPADWIEIDDRYDEELAGRRHLLATRHADVLAACPGSEPAAGELLDLLATHLAQHHPAWFHREGDTLHNRLTGEAWDLAAPAPGPLDVVGRLVQEDLCLIRPDEAGMVLDAAVLCAPSRWRLSEKIGRPMLAVHGPVPFYADRLGAVVDRFMRHLRPGRVAMRMNWSLVDDPALFQPGGHGRTDRDPAITPANAGAKVFFRMERQTFRLLPASGRVAFGIRVHRYPLARLAAVPGVAARLAAAVRALPPEMARYKSLGVFGDAMLAYLDAAAALSPAPAAP